MTKQETMEHLSNARDAHLKWVSRARLLIDGMPIEKDAIPLEGTECVFGQWFYGPGRVLRTLPSPEVIDRIEDLHLKLHDIYTEIFNIYFSVERKRFFLFSGKRRITQEQTALAKKHFGKLDAISKALLAEVSKLERRLNAMPPEALEEKLRVAAKKW